MSQPCKYCERLTLFICDICGAMVCERCAPLYIVHKPRLCTALIIAVCPDCTSSARAVYGRLSPYATFPEGA